MNRDSMLACSARSLAPLLATWGLLAGAASAGGLYTNEFASPSMGVAGAGAQAAADDASTAFHNPAGMTRLEDHRLLAGFGFVDGDVEFDPDGDTPIPGNDGGQQGGFGPILGSYYAHRLSDNWRLGAGLNAISAAVLDPDNQWAGRFELQELTVTVMELGLGVAWRVNDWLSVGAGPRLQYTSLEQKLAVPPPAGNGQVELDDIDDWEVGWKAGLLFELSARTRLGAIYVSKTEPDLSGDIKLRPVGAKASIDTEFTFPQLVRLGLVHELSDRWSLLASLGWEDWSDLDEQNVSVREGSGAIPRNWDDTYYASLGFHFRPNERWLLQAGFAYDSSPVKASDRTADLPIDRQLRYSFGAQYRWSENLDVGGAFVYADYGKGKIRSDLLRGEYDTQDLFFLTFYLSWRKVPWAD